MVSVRLAIKKLSLYLETFSENTETHQVLSQLLFWLHKERWSSEQGGRSIRCGYHTSELPCVPGILFLGVDGLCKFLLLFTWGLWRSLFSVYSNMCLLIAWWHATAKLLLLTIKKGKIDIYGDLGAGWAAALDFYCSWLHTCQTRESASHCGELVSISVWILLLGFGLHSVKLAVCRFTQANMQFMSAALTGTLTSTYLKCLWKGIRGTTVFLFLMDEYVV